MRQTVTFDCAGQTCVGTLDEASGTTGLLLVTGGNEIRSGAHAGQARLAAEIAGQGFPVFRYDRRGVGDSEGENGGFLSSELDIAAAATCFRSAAPQLTRVIAFGNCDAASALALFGAKAGLDHLILANPWVYDHEDEPRSDFEDSERAPAALPPASAIWKRYLSKLTNPREVIGLFTGKVDLRKLARGLTYAVTGGGEMAKAGLADRLARAFQRGDASISFVIADKDRTALAFMDAWKSAVFTDVRKRSDIEMLRRDTASHGFAGDGDFDWLRAAIVSRLSQS